MLKHVVLFQLKDKTAEKLAHFKKILEDLNPLIPELIHLEAGINMIESDRAMDLSVVADFKDQAGLEAYVVHPEHQKVVSWAKENCSMSKAVDYEF